MFAPWRSQKSMRKHKDPITGNSFISISQSGAAQCLQVTQPPKPESHGHQLQERSICLSFPCLSMKTKSEGCNHSIVESVTFVLFGSRVFSIRWQGLLKMKYKMDSSPQIVYLFERHNANMSANLGHAVLISAHFHIYQLKKYNFSADNEDLDQFSAFH